ncbi:MAG: hypothetical protein L0Z53_24935 [Acidobacteriales bacterium]|nr:hypothetical protein [Terriglobales bacterium]
MPTPTAADKSRFGPLAAVEAELERTMKEMDALTIQTTMIAERYGELQVALSALTERRNDLRRVSL